MKIKASEVTGSVLDWLVAKALGYTLYQDAALFGVVHAGWWISGRFTDPNAWVLLRVFQPSTNWSQGGPIIEREEVNLEIHEGGHTRASFYRMRLTFDGRVKHYHHQHGQTPLVAAMRCFVTSKLGDEVDVPKELLSC